MKKKKFLLVLLLVCVFAQTYAADETTSQSSETIDLLIALKPYLLGALALIIDHLIAKSKNKNNSLLQLASDFMKTLINKKK